jgi:PAS domain S-box-containing protein
MRAAVAKILESPDVLNLIFENAPDALFVIVAGGEIVKANMQAALMFGYSPDELVGQRVDILVPQRFAQIHANHHAEYFAAPRLRAMDADRNPAGRRKDGTEFPVNIMLSPLTVAGTQFVVAVVHDMSVQNKQEEELKTDRDLQLKEVHHRTKNNLQIVSSLLFLQSTHLSDPVALSAFRESQDRVKSIALIHEKLYASPDFARVDFRSYATDLITELVHSYQFRHEDLAVEIAIDDISMEAETTIPCGLMINELISNVFKHAFNPGEKGHLRVQLNSIAAGGYVLTVSDDGMGLPKDFNWRESESFGIKLVNDLATQLDGTVEVTVDRGTSFKVTFFQRRPNERR